MSTEAPAPLSVTAEEAGLDNVGCLALYCKWQSPEGLAGVQSPPWYEDLAVLPLDELLVVPREVLSTGSGPEGLHAVSGFSHLLRRHAMPRRLVGGNGAENIGSAFVSRHLAQPGYQAMRTWGISTVQTYLAVAGRVRFSRAYQANMLLVLRYGLPEQEAAVIALERLIKQKAKS